MMTFYLLYTILQLVSALLHAAARLRPAGDLLPTVGHRDHPRLAGHGAGRPPAGGHRRQGHAAVCGVRYLRHLVRQYHPQPRPHFPVRHHGGKHQPQAARAKLPTRSGIKSFFSFN